MLTQTNTRARMAQIVRSPLIASYNTRLDLSSDTLSQEGKTIYFGTGLAKPDAMSVGLPLDYLIMLVGAEFIRRKTGGEKIIQEISDTHCVSNNLATPEVIAALADQERRQINNLVYNLGMQDRFECIFASEYQSDPTYQAYKAEIDALAPNNNDYCRYQWAGDYYMASTQNVAIKLGWLTDDNNTPQGMDERFFNRKFKSLGVPGPDYAYTRCGWNWDNKNQRVSPYTRTAKENRPMLAYDGNTLDIILNNNANVGEKIAYRAISNTALIIDNFEGLFGELSQEDIWSDEIGALEGNFIAVKEDCDWAAGRSIDLGALCRKADVIRKMCL